MRTNINIVITNRNIFGFGQGRVVSLLNDLCAYAAQHLASRHASKRAHATERALKRRGSDSGVVAGAVLLVRQMCLALAGPQWQPVRHTSLVSVTA